MIGLLLLACTPELRDLHDWDDGNPIDTSDTGVHTAIELTAADDVWTARIDATDTEVWVALDLDAPAEVSTDDPTWDLRFQRFHISGHGGLSGDGGVQAVFAPGHRLDALPDVPEGSWRSDAPDGDDDDDDPDYALSTWYAYDETTHILTPVDGVWFVQSTEAAVYALQIDTYYDAVGSSAHPQIRWVGPLGSTLP